MAQIADNAKDGADFIVTTHETPTATILPFEKKPEMTRQEALEKLKELRKLYRGEPGSFNIREAIEDGRR
jgi:antitoxin (DNA-binding transcriptional repressor) of toxin-antitoxin stability system